MSRNWSAAVFKIHAIAFTAEYGPHLHNSIGRIAQVLHNKCRSCRERRFDSVCSGRHLTPSMAAPTTRIRVEGPSGGGDGEGGALHVTVMGPSLFSTFPLPKAGAVTIGRDEGADVRITDPDASREHARIHLGERIEIEDLGSTNGTRVREKRIEPGQRVPIMPGEAIGIGWTTLMVHSRRPPFKPRRLWPHGYFEGRLEEECERLEGADAAEGTFAVVRVRVEAKTGADAAADVLARALRPGDVLATYAADEYEALLVDTDQERARAFTGELSAALTGAGLTAQTVVAFYPTDGRSAEALIERATSLLHGRRGSGADPVVASESMRRVYALAQRAATSKINVLILGETGVGKEVLASAVHRMSGRKDGPFVCINCAALSETLLESELFGHEKGAFTGATHSKEGLLEAADGGTVFLDEVGEMPLPLQAKLLRAVESRQVTRVGGLKARSIDVRFVAATNRDLEREVERKTFREDLYYRLNGISLTIPPLRERPAEIESLGRSFLAQAAKTTRKRVPALSAEALELLTTYCWPGNIRELRNMMERAFLLCDGGEITGEHLPVEKMQGTRPELPEPGPAAATNGHRRSGTLDRQRILEALAKSAGNQTRAAKLLGMSRRAFCDWLTRLNIPRPRAGRGG
jgi:DNA-binding NtrC family response regulator